MPRLTGEEARRRLAAARVARLATITPQGTPHIVPVTFVLQHGVIYTAVDAKPKTTRLLRRLDNIRHSPAAAVLADHYSEDWTRLWWVRADGSASVIDDAGDLAGPARLLAVRYPQYQGLPPDGPVIAVAIERLTGWAASAAGAGQAGSGACAAAPDPLGGE